MIVGVGVVVAGLLCLAAPRDTGRPPHDAGAGPTGRAALPSPGPAVAADDGGRSGGARVGPVEGFGASVTGGAGGEVYWVTTLADSGPGSLRAGAESDRARWVRFSVSGRITLSSPIQVGDNTTIDGRGQRVEIAVSGHTTGMEIGSSNVIVHGLVWVGGRAARDGGRTADAINIHGGSRIWIDHNTMTGWGDKLLGMPVATDVTVSYNRFHDMGPGHAILIGTKATADRQSNTRVTVHHNVFEDIPDRSPRIGDGGYVHVYNNYVTGWSYYGMKAIRGARMLAENNVFGSAPNPRAILSSEGANARGLVRTSGNLLNGKTAESHRPGSVATPSYDYRLEPATTALRDRLLDAAGAEGRAVASQDPAPALSEHVDRVAGADRVATATAISRASFRSAGTVVVARSTHPADALAGGPLAAALGAPMLLTPPDHVPAHVTDEIVRLGASRVVVMGGPAAVSNAAADRLSRVRGVTDVDRVGGSTRYATAAEAARDAAAAWGTDRVSGVLVARGDSQQKGWPDALAATALAARTQQPLVLVSPQTQAAASDAIRDLGAEDVVVLGGTATLSNAVARSVSGGRSWRRIGGADRYATSALLANEAMRAGVPTSHVVVATGANWPDALAAGPAASAWDALVVLVPPTSLPAAPHMANWFATHGGDIEKVRLLGGELAVTDRVAGELGAHVGG